MEQLQAQGVASDPSRVSRWETGQAAATVPVLRAYERLTGADPGGLSAVALYLRRVATAQVRPQPGLPTEQLTPARLEVLLDRVVDGEPDGPAWLALGMACAAVGDRLVLPRSAWRGLTARLMRQLGVSVGAAYLCRIEAAVALTTHPSALRALLQAIGEMVTEPHVPVVTDPISVLQEVDSPQANQLVLRLLEQPAGSTRTAAAWAAAAKLERGHFSAEEQAEMEATLRRLVARDGLARDGSLNGILDLVEALPDAARARVLAPPAAADAGAPRAEAADPPEPRAEVVDALAREVVRRSGRDDPMLHRMAAEVIGSPLAEHRFLATFTLHQSPHRDTLAAVAADRVARSGGLPTGDPGEDELVHRLMVALTVVAGGPQAELMVRISENPASQLRQLALRALAHLPPGTFSRLPDLEPMLHGPDERLARWATYCAGMTGDPLLHGMVEDPAIGEARRRRALWWLDHGAAVHEGRTLPNRPGNGRQNGRS